MTTKFTTLILKPMQLQYLPDHWEGLLLAVVLLLLAGAEDNPASPFTLGLAGMLALYLLMEYIALRRKVFIITEETLIYERGILNRRSDYIELYRVVDFQQSQSFLQQLFGLKTVVVYSGDRTTPQLFIPGLPQREALVEELRKRVEYNKTRRGVYEITNRY